jgi:hypothetical protein
MTNLPENSGVTTSLPENILKILRDHDLDHFSADIVDGPEFWNNQMDTRKKLLALFSSPQEVLVFGKKGAQYMYLRSSKFADALHHFLAQVDITIREFLEDKAYEAFTLKTTVVISNEIYHLFDSDGSYLNLDKYKVVMDAGLEPLSEDH